MSMSTNIHCPPKANPVLYRLIHLPRLTRRNVQPSLSRLTVLALLFASFPGAGSPVAGIYIATDTDAQVAQRPVEQAALQPSPSSISQQPDKVALPTTFIPNVGQQDASVRFIADVAGSTVFFTPSEVVMVSILAQSTAASEEQPQDNSAPQSKTDETHTKAPSSKIRGSVARLRFIDANRSPNIIPAQALPGKVNYLRGSNSSKWYPNVPTYASIMYKGLFPGIDLTYESSNHRLKATYHVAPGANPELLRWTYDGAQTPFVDAEGNLNVRVPVLGEVGDVEGTDAITLTEHTPVAWQEINGSKVPVQAEYRASSNGTISFSLGSYDTTRELIIDPVVSYATYLGGSGDDYIASVAVDSNDNMYVAGLTTSVNFPVRNPVRGELDGQSDAFVTKIHSSGAYLLYSTYLGGSMNDQGSDLILDSVGNIHLVGRTSSTDFPTASAIQGSLGGGTDAFVATINTTGSGLLYSTYLGGLLDDAGASIAVDAQDYTYVVGTTASVDFPTANAMQPASAGNTDTFITKLNPSGSAFIYSSYLGGSQAEWGAGAFFGPNMGIAADAEGNAYVSGSTNSTDFPTTTGAFQPGFGGGGSDAYVAKLNSTGSALAYSTFLGGSDSDYGGGVAVDSTGKAYLTGYTRSTNFPITPGAAQPTNAGTEDAFITKVNSAGTGLVYSTYLGGSRYPPRGTWYSSTDLGVDLAIDASGNAYAVGWTNSIFPFINDFAPRGLDSLGDTFLAKLNPSGTAFVYASWYGAKADSTYNNREGATGVAVDSSGTNVYVVGQTQGSDFATVNPLQPTFLGAGGTGSSSRYQTPTRRNLRQMPLLFRSFVAEVLRRRGQRP